MTEQVQDTQTEQKQEPIILQLTLNLDQINFILGALGKLPTESGAWVVRQVVAQQAQQQVQELTEKEDTETKETLQ